MRRPMTFLATALLSSAGFSAIAAADVARVTTDLNMRAGPSTEFPVVSVLPDGASVNVFGCVRGYSWCDVSWRGRRGWASASYLTQSYRGSYVPLVEYGPRINVPIVGFSIGSYWDNHYRNDPWYGRRDRWRSVWRGNDDRRDRRRDRVERREERREERQERREDRRDDRAERRERRQELRTERRREAIRERRQEQRQERRAEQRRERRQEQRVERRDRRQEFRAERRQERRAERRGRGNERQIQRNSGRDRSGREARGRIERRGGDRGG
jgi:uncharacterized protein YraI